MLMKLGFYGFLMVELRATDNGMYMIEANPRLWGPSQLFVDANVPIFEYFLDDAGFDIPGHKTNNQITGSKYFWFGGMSQQGLDDADLAFHGMTKAEFRQQLKEYLEVDVYRRPDTLSIYENEVRTQTKR